MKTACFLSRWKSDDVTWSSVCHNYARSNFVGCLLSSRAWTIAYSEQIQIPRSFVVKPCCLCRSDEICVENWALGWVLRPHVYRSLVIRFVTRFFGFLVRLSIRASCSSTACFEDFVWKAVFENNPCANLYSDKRAFVITTATRESNKGKRKVIRSTPTLKWSAGITSAEAVTGRFLQPFTQLVIHRFHLMSLWNPDVAGFPSRGQS